jgi:hypothetical protein
VNDRVVHGYSADGWAVVRYDRSGKWYEEHASLKPRRQLALRQAVALVCEPGATVFYGRPGGSTFDRRVRALKHDKETRDV